MKVSEFMKEEGINCLTAAHHSGSEESLLSGTCSACKEEISSESYFSWTPCECCNSHLGGDRYHASGYNSETMEVYCYEVCPDCLERAEYGDNLEAI